MQAVRGHERPGDARTYKKKVVLLGDSGVGKTSLIRRYVFNQFDEGYVATIGSRVSKKQLSIERRHGTYDLTLMIWDVIGSHGYDGLHARTFVGVHGAIMVVDLTRRDTLQSLEGYWIPFLGRVVEQVPMVLVGNKSDLRDAHELTLDDLMGIASRFNPGARGELPHGLETAYITSAKSGENVEQAFEALGHMLLASSAPADPVKELYQGLMATGIQRSSDRSTAIGALDAIIVDFCKGFEDSRMAMTVLRQELDRAALDVGRPTRASLSKAVECLAEAETEFKDERTVRANLERRRALVAGVRDSEP
jgi:small GTP-binding protein